MTEKAAELQPAYDELIRQAAQGGVLHNDDTSMRVLALNKAQAQAADAASERTGILFYKTRNGARMGDLFMSLIHTCELCGVNPFDYLTELQQHMVELKSKPSDWMPWKYRDTLQQNCVNVNSA